MTGRPPHVVASSRPVSPDRPSCGCLDNEAPRRWLMGKVKQGMWTARLEGDFVIFIIGTRPDPLHPVRWWNDIGGMRGMLHMLKYLSNHPEKGMLGYHFLGLTIVQYWRSFEHLEAFAADRDDPHASAMRTYWKRVGTSARSGIWHETFLVRAGEYEAIYANMPPHGLGKVAELLPQNEDSSARQRLRRQTR
jgi:hypothetical protein